MELKNLKNNYYLNKFCLKKSQNLNLVSEIVYLFNKKQAVLLFPNIFNKFQYFQNQHLFYNNFLLNSNPIIYSYLFKFLNKKNQLIIYLHNYIYVLCGDLKENLYRLFDKYYILSSFKNIYSYKFKKKFDFLKEGRKKKESIVNINLLRYEKLSYNYRLKYKLFKKTEEDNEDDNLYLKKKIIKKKKKPILEIPNLVSIDHSYFLDINFKSNLELLYFNNSWSNFNFLNLKNKLIVFSLYSDYLSLFNYSLFSKFKTKLFNFKSNNFVLLLGRFLKQNKRLVLKNRINVFILFLKWFRSIKKYNLFDPIYEVPKKKSIDFLFSIFNSSIFEKLINLLIKKGKKEKAELLFFNLLSYIKQRMLISPFFFIYKSLINIYYAFSIKKVKAYGKIQNIPVLISSKKSFFLSCKLILNFTKKKENLDSVFLLNFLNQLRNCYFKRDLIYENYKSYIQLCKSNQYLVYFFLKKKKKKKKIFKKKKNPFFNILNRYKKLN